MKSQFIGAGENILASDLNTRRDDSAGAGSLLAHQQLGALALGTNASNNQVVPIVINGTTITVTFVSSIGATANNVLIGASAAASVVNLIGFLRRPDLTSSTQVAASSANQTLLQYVGWSLPAGGTTITPFSLNNSSNAPLTTFNITGITVTSGSWTANTMRLYVEAGTYYIGTTQVKYLGGSTATVTAPGANPRIDVLTLDTSGTLAWTTGTENASPTVPSYPTGKYPICELYNVVSETALYDNQNQQTSQGYIQADVRPITNLLYINNSTQIASGIVLFDPGSDAQGDVYYWTGSALARLPAGTNGQFLQTQGAGANPKWNNASPDLYSIGTIQTFASPTTEATVATFTLLANTLGTNGGLGVKALENASTSGAHTDALTWRLYIGGTVVATASFSNFSAASGKNVFLEGVIWNNNATNAQTGFLRAIETSTPTQNSGSATGAVDTTTNLTVKLTVQKTTNNDSIVFAGVSFFLI
jgi:hypothetical protein